MPVCTKMKATVSQKQRAITHNVTSNHVIIRGKSKYPSRKIISQCLCVRDTDTRNTRKIQTEEIIKGLQRPFYMKLLKAEWEVNQQQREIKCYMIRQIMRATLHSNWQQRTEEWRQRESLSKTCSSADYWWWRHQSVFHCVWTKNSKSCG